MLQNRRPGGVWLVPTGRGCGHLPNSELATSTARSRQSRAPIDCERHDGPMESGAYKGQSAKSHDGRASRRRPGNWIGLVPPLCECLSRRMAAQRALAWEGDIMRREALLSSSPPAVLVRLPARRPAFFRPSVLFRPPSPPPQRTKVRGNTALARILRQALLWGGVFVRGRRWCRPPFPDSGPLSMAAARDPHGP